MDNYFRIYLQQEKDGADVIDVIESFGMYCMENPFKPCEKVKEPSKRSWYDENGDDEYISPSDGLLMEAYENSVKFGFHGKAYGANDKLKSFLGYLRGGMMKMYCEFNGIGRQHVRLSSIDPSLYRDVRGDEDILTVSITFKFNDPSTDVSPVRLGKKVVNLLPST